LAGRQEEILQLMITNSLTLDDINRGLKLDTVTSSPSAPGGAFDIGGSSVAEVVCMISGAGPLTKRGSGTLLLATNETYTGITTVEEGLLQLSEGASLMTSEIVVTGSTAVVVGSSLTNVSLYAGGTLAAAGSGCDVADLDMQDGWLSLDLSSASPDTALIRVSGDLSLADYQVVKLTVNTNMTSETPYKVLSASNLSGFADYDFCLDEPWLGELSLADDGLGGKVLLFTPTPPEKIVFKIESDLINTTGFVLAGKWSDGESPTNEPTGVKTYVMETAEMRTPHNQSMTFGGKRLIMDFVPLALKGQSYMSTIEDLTVMNMAWFSMAEYPRGNLNGNIRLHPVLEQGKTFALQVSCSSAGRDLHLHAQLSGYGDLLLQGTGNPQYDVTDDFLYADNTNFYGRIRLNGQSNLWLRVTSEKKIGGQPLQFRSDQLAFNGGGMSVTNDVVIDDANRGITLLDIGGYLSINSTAGAFTNGTPAEERWFDGGAVLRAENAATLTITCPVTGGGRLIKAGTGTLELGGSNSYTGQTSIVEGGIFAATADAFGTGPVKVSGAGRLVCRYSDSMLTNGVELDGMIEFINGGAVKVELANGVTQPTGTFSVPLFLLPEGESINTEDVPLEHALDRVYGEVVTSAVGSQTLISAEFTFTGGTLILLR
jgi:autotransporter-associated beta strand protein